MRGGGVFVKKVLFSILAALTVIGLVGCTQPVYGDEIKSSQPRVTPVSIPASDTKALVDGDTAFALDIYQKIKQGSDNLFYSPYSISSALAMTWAGAQGDTEKQMAAALHFTLPQDRLHTAFNALDQELKKRSQGAKGKDEKGFRLNIVNAIWGQKDYSFLPAFLDTLAQNYGAGLRVVDYRNAPEPSRVTINDWVAQQTEDRIKDLLPQGSITSLTRLVLTNAVYFNAAWLMPFDKALTGPGPFYLLDGKAVAVPMMKHTGSFGYYKTDLYEVVDLPYDGRELSMVILLPKSGQFTAIENVLGLKLLGEALGGVKNAQVALTMPKFKTESSFSVKQALAALGMTDAFNPNIADLSGMTGNRELYISDVVHKSFVEVDEDGTEAAAATGVIVGTTSAPAEPVKVVVDRPFIFLIRDIKTGAVIFVGRIANPA